MWRAKMEAQAMMKPNKSESYQMTIFDFIDLDLDLEVKGKGRI